MHHHVYFWLKEEYQTEEKKAVFEAALDELCTISVIKSGGWGIPAKTTKRPVIDDSYCYAAYSSFDSIADHDIYQDHPLHLKFVGNHKDWWEKVQIMDVE